MTTSPHLAGPWVAVMADPHGYIYRSLADVRAMQGINVSVRRGTAAPAPGDDRTPETHDDGDVLYENKGLYLDDGVNTANSLNARWEQARKTAEVFNGLADPYAEAPGARWPNGNVVAFDSDDDAREYFDRIGHLLDGPWPVLLVTTVHGGPNDPDYLTAVPAASAPEAAPAPTGQEGGPAAEPTRFIEANALLAIIRGEIHRARELVDELLPGGERGRLYRACNALQGLIDVLDAPPGPRRDLVADLARHTTN